MANKCNQKINENTKIQKYGKIISSSNIIKRNIKIINLDLGFLTNEQLKKINYIIETKETKTTNS